MSSPEDISTLPTMWSFTSACLNQLCADTLKSCRADDQDSQTELSVGRLRRLTVVSHLDWGLTG